MDEEVKLAAVSALLRERRQRLADHSDGHVILDADEVQKLEVEVSRLAQFIARVTGDPKRTE